MRIVAISDTHSLHRRINDMPNGDVLVHCGDFCSYGTGDEALRFASWLREIRDKYKHIVVISGNHDKVMETVELEAAKNIFRGVIYLFDESTEIENMKFYGSPWQPEFMDWSFNVPRGPKIAKKWEDIPNNTDVLITHGPPHGILDLCPDIHNRNKSVHAGCEELRKTIKRVKPKLHLFGHIHEGYGIEERDGVIFANASICTGRYKPTNKPLVLEI